jgi:hypothetical protein
MSVFAPNFGANAAGTDPTSLFLKMYAGSYTEAWRSATFLWDSTLPIISRQTISPGGGKSFQFLMDADLPEPEDFDPGNEVSGQNYAVEEGVITLDKYLVAHAYVKRDQMMQSHFQILPRLGKRHAMRLGRVYDRRLMILAAKAARQTTAVSKNGMLVHSGGNRVTRGGATIAGAYAASAAGASNLRSDLRSLGRLQDIDLLPNGERYVLMRPEAREALLYDNTSTLFSRDFQDSNRVLSRSIPEVDGYKILAFPTSTSQNGPMPDQNLTSGLPKYQGNFAAGASDGIPAVIALSPGPDGGAAVGVVTYESVQHAVVWKQERLAYLVMSYLYCGADIMHPYCAGSIEVTTP